MIVLVAKSCFVKAGTGKRCKFSFHNILLIFYILYLVPKVYFNTILEMAKGE